MRKIRVLLSKLPIKKINNRKNPRGLIALAVVLVLTAVSIFMVQLNTAYTIKVNGSTIGVVREKEEFTQIIDRIKETLHKAYDTEIVFTESIEYEKTRAKKENLSSTAELEKALKQTMNFKVKGFAIKANEKTVAVLLNKADAERVLEELKKPYNEGNTDIEQVYFGENVVVEEAAAEMKDLKSYEDALKLIQQGTEEIKIHEVQKGENSWTISRKYNLSVEDIAKANPDINPEKLQINQKISLTVPKPLLTVVTVRKSRYEEAIPFETVFEETGTLYKDEKKIKVAGKNGSREVLAEIVAHNNIEVSRNILEEKIIESPVKQVVLQGTKNPPPKIGTGTFSNPTRGSLSSRFGSRWGRMHEGIDIAAKIGTPVYAADGGKVTFSGTKSGYGKIVIIDHGGGFQTYYAHNSKLVVSSGDKVYKGQKIAEVGNTGRSTGPHLHFEVRKNGKPINPLSYVKY